MQLQESPAVHHTLDTRGSYCPIPVIRTARRVEDMTVGEVLELLSDDRGVLADIPDWCLSHGHTYLGHRQESGWYCLYLRKVTGRRSD